MELVVNSQLYLMIPLEGAVASVYRLDAFQLLASGLPGGDGR